MRSIKNLPNYNKKAREWYGENKCICGHETLAGESYCHDCRSKLDKVEGKDGDNDV